MEINYADVEWLLRCRPLVVNILTPKAEYGPLKLQCQN